MDDLAASCSRNRNLTLRENRKKSLPEARRKAEGRLEVTVSSHQQYWLLQTLVSRQDQEVVFFWTRKLVNR